MHTKTFFMLAAIWILILLSSCATQPDTTATLVPSPLPTETRTPEPSPTWTPVLTATLAFTATPTPVPVLISLTEYGGSGADEFISCLRAYGKEHFLLYQDGFLINFGPHYYSAQLSQEEIDSLISQIEATGFFDVEGTGELGDDDPIYNFEGENPIDSGWGTSINVLGKEVWIEGSLGQYLVTPIRETITLIRTYHHEDEIPFKPNKLGVFFSPAYEEFVDPDNLKEVFWESPIDPEIEWPDELPPISSYLESYRVYFENEDLDKLLEVFPNIPSYGVFYEEETAYLVFACFPER